MDLPLHVLAFKNGTPAEKCAAAADVPRYRPVDQATIEGLVELLGDEGYYDRRHPHGGMGPDYDFVARRAREALVALGADAVPALERGLASTRCFSWPDPSYDQGVYIGDYGGEHVCAAGLAADALCRIGAAASRAIPAL